MDMVNEDNVDFRDDSKFWVVLKINNFGPLDNKDLDHGNLLG